ncbi:MAG TPA: heavy metal translocating P-type ATPase [Ferrovibrio sp.]|uniref:heavy metal translocating P-type ATPase n=1 Tax=Ferrovibrio sp. TaxID=1917215 RepID=UPI002ED6ABF3
MNQHPPEAAAYAGPPAAQDGYPSREEVMLASRLAGKDLREVRFSVPSIHCGGCLRSIERALGRLDNVAEVRANLTTKSVTVRWPDGAPPPPIAETLAAIGHTAHLGSGDAAATDRTQAELIRALAVAGFAAGNIMLFSVSVWSGAEAELRNLFHVLSAVIAFPTLVYSGRIFYRSAWAAIRHGRTNMDVPISIGVALAFAMSLYDTVQGGPHAYFDAAVMLLFFLLIGRTLDHFMRARARSAVGDLAKLTARGASVEHEDGSRSYLPVDEIRPGMTILLAAGERVPVDARVRSGASTIDRSLVTGESAPRPVSADAVIEAGTLNLTGPLRLEAISTARDSFLAEMVQLMSAAEAGRSAYRRLADKAAGLYAPLVHSAAFLAFLGWAVATGDYHRAATIAIAVLIITCPCALGLAVPIVQVVAARRLYERGVMVKDGAGLERLAEADTVVFDKTGTLTADCPELAHIYSADDRALELAAALAAHSRHPQSLAIVAAQAAQPKHGETRHLDDLREVPGQGLEARAGSALLRLGRAEWALDDPAAIAALRQQSRTILSRNGQLVAAFAFRERLRPGAQGAIATLKDHGIAVEILSGDHAGAVESLAGNLGVTRFAAGLRPGDKLTRLEALAQAGRKVLMVGDGLNDAPALAAAHVSMAPSSAVDVGRNAADFVFMRGNLEAVPFALAIARRAGRLIRENFALAILYNAVALPFAVAGYVTPLAAALAMSASSLLVVGNALRLNRERPRKTGRKGAPSLADRAAQSLPVAAGGAE